MKAADLSFRSIVFGAYDDGQLKFVAHSGSGFKDEVMHEVIDRLKPLETQEKPFADDVNVPAIFCRVKQL